MTHLLYRSNKTVFLIIFSLILGGFYFNQAYAGTQAQPGSTGTYRCGPFYTPGEYCDIAAEISPSAGYIESAVGDYSLAGGAEGGGYFTFCLLDPTGTNSVCQTDTWNARGSYLGTMSFGGGPSFYRAHLFSFQTDTVSIYLKIDYVNVFYTHSYCSINICQVEYGAGSDLCQSDQECGVNFPIADIWTNVSNCVEPCNVVVDYNSSYVSTCSIYLNGSPRWPNLQPNCSAGTQLDNNLSAGSYTYQFRDDSTGSILDSATVVVSSGGGGFCGDGSINQPSEECDDGVGLNGACNAYCSTSCTINNCGGGACSSGIDIGLRLFESGNPLCWGGICKIAVYPANALSSQLRLYKSTSIGTGYHTAVLVDPTDSNASKMRVIIQGAVSLEEKRLCIIP